MARIFGVMLLLAVCGIWSKLPITQNSVPSLSFIDHIAIAGAGWTVLEKVPVTEKCVTKKLVSSMYANFVIKKEDKQISRMQKHSETYLQL